MAEKIIETIDRKGKLHLTNVRDEVTGLDVSYTETSEINSDSQCDGIIFKKHARTGKYVKRNFDVATVEMFGAIGNGVADDTAAFARARQWAFKRSPLSSEIRFTREKYLISASPNWAIRGLRLTVVGRPEIICTGSGPVFEIDPGSGSAVFNMYVGSFILTGNMNTRVICKLFKVAQSTFDNIVARNANPEYGIAFNIQNNVLNTYNKPTCSVNGTGMDSNLIPKWGMYFETHAIGASTANIFNNTTMEGVGIGIEMLPSSCDNAIFNGGTSEGNYDGGVVIGWSNRMNSFFNFAMELNGNFDVRDSGRNTLFKGGYSTGLMHFIMSRFSEMKSMRSQRVVIGPQSRFVSVQDLSISSFDGATGVKEIGDLVDNGRESRIENVHNFQTDAFVADRQSVSYKFSRSFTNGTLLKTNIARGTVVALELFIQGIKYPSEIIDTTISVYVLDTETPFAAKINAPRGASFEVSSFFRNGLLYFWIPGLPSLSTVRYFLKSSISGLEYSYALTSATNEVKPTSGITYETVFIPQAAQSVEVLEVSKSTPGGAGGMLNLINKAPTAAGNSTGIKFAPSATFESRYSAIMAVNGGDNDIDLTFITGYAATITEKMRLKALSGALLIGGTIDNGVDKLQVTGSIKASGVIRSGQYTTATRPAYSKGAEFFDATLNKKIIGGASGWEVVSSTAG